MLALGQPEDGQEPGGALDQGGGRAGTGPTDDQVAFPMAGHPPPLMAEAVAEARERFGGPIGYASLPIEMIDWSPLDFIATDAGYRDAANAAALPATLAALTSQGKPVAVTEFGCATFVGDGGVDTPFVYTFASRHLPASDDPERDFDRGSFGIVKVFAAGRTGVTYPGMPWEPKAAFHALTDYGRARAQTDRYRRPMH